jgi:hypothetical protein
MSASTRLRLDDHVPSSHLPFEQFEGFAVAAALEEMAEFGIDLRREGLFEALDFFGNVAEPVGVASGIAAAFIVADDGEAFAESSGEGG